MKKQAGNAICQDAGLLMSGLVLFVFSEVLRECLWISTMSTVYVDHFISSLTWV